MKAKTLLIAAATLAVGAISSQAQVYSQNVVGYVNLTLTNGYTLVANQLDIDGTGTNNTVYTTIGTNLVSGSKILSFDPVSQTYKSIQINGSGVWSAGSGAPFVKAGLQPGGSVFVFNAGSTPTNITLVGTVLQQTNITSFPSQYQMAANHFPVAGYITTNFNYVANAPVGTVKDKVLTWNVTSQTFVTHQFSGTAWSGGSPSVGVGEGFFLIPDQTTIWTNGFSVGP